MTRLPIFSALGQPTLAESAERLEVSREVFAEKARILVENYAATLDLLYAIDERRERGCFAVHAVFSLPDEKAFITLRTTVPQEDPTYPSLTTTIMAAHWYERLIGDQFGIVAQQHPDARRLMHHQNIPAQTFPMRKDFAWDTRLPHASEPYPMHAVEGKGIYEIPVGPIHAGIIEPGHFRFNVRGERILTLEGKLFFKHKGVEKILEGKTPLEAMPFVEQVTGNMPVAHALAFVQAVESATKTEVPLRAKYLRVFFNELERITMHVFDLGNMAGNGTGFTFVAAQCFRLVEDLRRLNTRLTGHRFLRGMIIPGGLSRDLSAQNMSDALQALEKIELDLAHVLSVVYGSDGLMERFETTGILKKDAAIAYGAKGTPARASGVARDERCDHPYATYHLLDVQMVTKADGDVRARFDLRVDEIKESLRLIRAVFFALSDGAIQIPVILGAGEAYGSSEGWLGQVLDWVRLDATGHIDRVVIRDPSFCNWALFGEIGPGNIVPDFPLCNKSLNLSYSGTDL